MRAEVVSIGDEIVSGQRLDTNTQWLSERLAELGVRVLYHSTVGDELEPGERVFAQAIDRADIIVSTGGLGPTADDLTRQAIAAATGCPLEVDPGALEHIRSLFARRQRPMPESNLIQAYFPAGSRIIPNPHGTAPGIDMEIPRGPRAPARLFALPGVPAEMKEMWGATVQPALIAVCGSQRRQIRHRRIKCFGVGESDLEQMLPDLIRRGRSPAVGITVSEATITLRITASGDSEDACAAAISPTIATIRECLGQLVFGEEEEELQHVVLALLAGQRATLATVEWGTTGLLAHWLSAAAGQEASYLGGTIVSDLGMVAKALELSLEQIRGCASPELVATMAQACRRRFASDYALAVGPVPEEEAGSPEPARIHVALASAGGVEGHSFVYAGHPAILKPRSAKQALNVLRLSLLEQHKN